MKRRSSKSFLWLFSIFFFVICLAEGVLYYGNEIENVFLGIALIIQNAIEAFALSSEIKISDAFALIDTIDSSLFHIFLTYMYVITIILAPFCTAGALLLLAKKPFYYIEGLLKSRKDKVILIFGEGDNKKSFVNAIKKSVRVIIYEKQELSEEEALKYMKDGIVHFTDMGRGTKQTKCLKKMHLDKMDYILMCDDNSLINLYYLKTIYEFFDRYNPKNKDLVCYIQCQEFGMKEVIQRYYDSLTNKYFDLNIVDIKQKAVNKMFLEHKLYEYNKINNSKDVHLAIIGFGDYGQNTLIQALNLGVFSSASTICIDVFDKDMSNIIGVFLKKFSSDILDCPEENVPVGDVNANYVINLPTPNNQSLQVDGKVVLRFWSVDVGTIQFNRILNNCIKKDIFTYAVVAVNDKKLMAATLLEIQKLLHNNVPIIVRVNNEEQSFEFLNTITDYNNVHLINQSKDIYSLESICNEDIVNMAKEFNRKYSEIEADNNRQSVEWIKIPLFKRESAIAQAMHQEVKEWLLKESPSIEEEHGILEHRRWCLFMISNGYKYKEGIKNDIIKTNPCICKWDKLLIDKPDMIEHDFTPYQIVK